MIMEQIDRFLDNLFQTDVNIDNVMFWVFIGAGILATILIATIGCQLESILLHFKSNKKNKKKKRK